MQSRPQTLVGASACAVCHRRKIKCDRAERAPCSNCAPFGYECRPHHRKRKYYGESTSAEDQQSSSATQTTVPEQDSSIETDRSANAKVQRTGRQQRPLSATLPATGFLGRSEYLGDNGTYDESAVNDVNDVIPHSVLSPDDMRVLEIRRAFDLPERATAESLWTTFFERCHPWMPVVDELDSADYKARDKLPIIMVQAIFMAASRIHPRLQSSSELYYNRSKVLFFMGCEKDPMTLIITTLFLQWWNPSGPEKVSIHSSSYWLRIGIGLAQQVGLHLEPDTRRHSGAECILRRKVWWTLYARDCLLSVGQGRPRAINPDDCFVRPISLSDFRQPTKHAHVFVAYVEVSSILGRITDWYLRGAKSIAEFRRFELDLMTWIGKLPECLQPTDASGRLKPYDFHLWQLYLPYLSALCIMHRTSRRTETLHLTALLASSCTVRIVEDLLARDDLRCVNAMLAIYLLIAGLALLSTYEHPNVWPNARPDFEVVVRALDELSKTWHTAKGSLRILRRAQELIKTRPISGILKLEAHEDHVVYFERFGEDFCSQWNFLLPLIKTKKPLIPQDGNGNNTTLASATSGLPLGIPTVDDGLQPGVPTAFPQAVDVPDLDFSQLLMTSLTPESTDICMGQYSDWFLQGWEQDYTGDFSSFDV